MGLDWIGLDGWLSYTAVTPRASLKSDANKFLVLLSDQDYFSPDLLSRRSWLPLSPQKCPGEGNVGSCDSEQGSQFQDLVPNIESSGTQYLGPVSQFQDIALNIELDTLTQYWKL